MKGIGPQIQGCPDVASEREGSTGPGTHEESQEKGRETVKYVARAKTAAHAIVGREIYFAGHSDSIREVYISNTEDVCITTIRLECSVFIIHQLVSNLDLSNLSKLIRTRTCFVSLFR